MARGLLKSYIPLQDPATGNARDVIAAPNVRWSSGSTWHGLTAEAYRLENIETPEFQTVDHSLVLHLAPRAFIELKTDGRYDKRTRISGDLSIIPAATVCQVRSQEAHEVLVISLSQQVMAYSELRDYPGLLLRPYLRDRRLEHICRALKSEAESNYISGTLYGESLAVALGACLLGRYSFSNVSSNQLGGIAPRALRRVIDFMESNLESPLQMDTLAKVAGLSHYRFAHNFRAKTGVPPHQYVTRLRLEQAKRMLRETNLSIVEIAGAVGLHGSSRFNSLFKREMGITPSAFRTSFR
jgi:AraC family transcriptional regulator